MSKVTSFKKSFSLLREEWKNLDRTIRFLDILTILLVLLFGIAFILTRVTSITLIVSNAALMIFPLILAGYTFVLRSKLADVDIDNREAKKEYIFLVGLTIGLVLLTFVYSIVLN